jgi:membrane-associated phospholipid phosphatase
MTVDSHPSAGERPDHHRAGSAVVRAGVPLLAIAVAIAGLMWIVGSLLVDGLLPGFVGRADTQTAQWAVAHRAPWLDEVTHVGTMTADTIVALAVTAVALVGLRLWLSRWRESLVLVVAVVGELLIFLVITATVHRERPSVPQLDQAPPTSSFPSGHTGAAVALYGCLAVILLRNTSRRWVAVGLALVGFAIPILVAASRVYRGMHFLTDVVAGAIAGGIWLAVVLMMLLRPRAPVDSVS